jgi:hypothetical protein
MNEVTWQSHEFNFYSFLPFDKGGNWFLSMCFHPHLVPRSGMKVYPKNIEIGETRINKK